jgi:hypothetical protein
MKMRLSAVRQFASGLLGLLLASVCAGEGIAITPKVGTTGAGADLTVGIARSVNLRLGAQGWSRSETRTEQEVEYEAHLTLVSGEILLDFHPRGGGFRVSAGAVVNGNEVTAVSTEAAVYTINGVQYPVGLVGRLHGKVETNSVAPYLGIGWGNAVARASPWHFAADLGAFYQGSPKVSLRAESPFLALLPARFEEDLETERRKIEDDLDAYRVYPVVSLGVSYRF